MVMAFLLSSMVFAEPVALDQKKVAELVISKSYKAQETSLTSQLSRLNVASAKSAYDWTMSFTTGFERSRFQNFAGTLNPQDDTLTSALSLTKTFTSGTALTGEASRTSLQSIIATGGPASVLTTQPRQTLDLVGFTIEQNLWRNFFGTADRATIEAAEKADEASEILRVDNLQDVVLEGIRLFWTAYVAEETFKEAINARERYAKLVDVVRKKNSLGYANPGELAQVQAEYELRLQNVKKESTNFLAVTDQLTTLLQLSPGADLKFEVSEEVPELPKLTKVGSENLRAVESAQLKLSAAEAAVKASESKGRADLSFIGKGYTMGLGTGSTDSMQELVGGSRPKFYVGLRYAFSFGSGYYTEDLANKKIQRDIDQSALSRTLLETRDNLENGERKAQAAYSVAVSAKRLRDLRSQAASELQKSYNQGRTDIRNLIDALNNFFSSEIQYSQAIGDYQIALNEWAAVRDELIPATAK